MCYFVVVNTQRKALKISSQRLSTLIELFLFLTNSRKMSFKFVLNVGENFNFFLPFSRELDDH